jgi:hypothetical protein
MNFSLDNNLPVEINHYRWISTSEALHPIWELD